MLGSDAWPTFEQVHRLTYIRQILDETLRLWPTAPGFSRHPYEDTVIGGRYAIPGAHPDHSCSARRCTVHPSRLGPRRGGVQPRAHRRRADGRTPAERLQAVRHRRSGRASAGSSPCRRPCWCSACCCSASTSSTTGTTSSGRRPRSPSSPTTSTSWSGRARRPARARPGPQPISPHRVARRCRRTATATAAGAPRRPPRHAAVGALRLEPRHRGVHRDPARPGGHRARLRRDPRRARRPRRRAPGRAARPSSSARPTTGPLRTTPPPSAGGSAVPAQGRRTASPTRCSAAATPSGPRPTRPCPTLLDDAARGARRAAGSAPAR